MKVYRKTLELLCVMALSGPFPYLGLSRTEEPAGLAVTTGQMFALLGSLPDSSTCLALGAESVLQAVKARPKGELSFELSPDVHGNVRLTGALDFNEVLWAARPAGFVSPVPAWSKNPQIREHLAEPRALKGSLAAGIPFRRARASLLARALELCEAEAEAPLLEDVASAKRSLAYAKGLYPKKHDRVHVKMRQSAEAGVDRARERLESPDARDVFVHLAGTDSLDPILVSHARLTVLVMPMRS